MSTRDPKTNICGAIAAATGALAHLPAGTIPDGWAHAASIVFVVATALGLFFAADGQTAQDGGGGNGGQILPPPSAVISAPFVSPLAPSPGLAASQPNQPNPNPNQKFM